MPKNLFTFNFKKTPSAFLAALLLVACAEAGLRHSDRFWNFCLKFGDPARDAVIRWNAKIHQAMRSDQGRKIFILGSSQARDAVDEDYLNSLPAFKGRVIFFNLGLGGGGTPADIFMAEKKIIGAKPDRIFYLTNLGTFYLRDNFERLKLFFDPVIIPFWIEYLSPRYLVNNRLLIQDAFWGQVSFFYHYRESLRRFMDYAYLIFLDEPLPYLAYQRKAWPSEKFGQTILAARQHYFTRRAQGLMNERLFDELCEKFKQRGIELVVVDTPNHPRLSELHEPPLRLTYRQFLKERSRRFGYRYVTWEDLPAFTEDDFFDFTHLNDQGREKFTRFLETFIKENPNSDPDEIR